VRSSEVLECCRFHFEPVESEGEADRGRRVVGRFNEDLAIRRACDVGEGWRRGVVRGDGKYGISSVCGEKLRVIGGEGEEKEEPLRELGKRCDHAKKK